MSDLTRAKTAQALRHLARYHREECGNVDAFSADQLDEWAEHLDPNVGPPLKPRPNVLSKLLVEAKSEVARMRHLLTFDARKLLSVQVERWKEGGFSLWITAGCSEAEEDLLIDSLYLRLTTLMPGLGLNEAQQVALQGANQWLQDNNGGPEAEALAEAFSLPKVSE